MAAEDDRDEGQQQEGQQGDDRRDRAETADRNRAAAPRNNPPEARDRERERGRAADEPRDAPGPDDRDREIAKLKAALKETNRKGEADRRFREEREAEEARRKEADLPEVEKFRAKADQEAERARLAEERAQQVATRLVEMRLEVLVTQDARKAGFLYPETAYRLIDRARLEYDEEAERWDGVAGAVEKLARDYPDLVRARRPGPGSPPRDEHPGNPARRPGRAAQGNASGAAAGNGEPSDPFAAFAGDITGNYERM